MNEYILVCENCRKPMKSINHHIHETVWCADCANNIPALSLSGLREPKEYDSKIIKTIEVLILNLLLLTGLVIQI